MGNENTTVCRMMKCMDCLWHTQFFCVNYSSPTNMLLSEALTSSISPLGEQPSRCESDLFIAW